MKTKIIIGCCCLLILCSCNPPNNQKEDISVKGMRITEVLGEIPNPLYLDYQYHSDTKMEDGSTWQLYLEKGKSANKDSYYVWGKLIPANGISTNDVQMYVYPMDLSIANVNHIYSWLEKNIAKGASMKVESPKNYQGKVKLIDIYNHCKSHKTKIIVSYKSINEGKTIYVTFDGKIEEMGLSLVLTHVKASNIQKEILVKDRNAESKHGGEILDPQVLQYQEDGMEVMDDGTKWNRFVQRGKGITKDSFYIWIKFVPKYAYQSPASCSFTYKMNLSLMDLNNLILWLEQNMGTNVGVNVVESPKEYNSTLRLNDIYTYCIKYKTNFTISYKNEIDNKLALVDINFEKSNIGLTYVLVK